MTVARSLFNICDRPGLRSGIAVARSVQTSLQGDPAWVSWRAEGWLHRSRGGTLILPEPRGLSVAGWRDLAMSVFCREYQPVAGDTVVELGAGVGTETLTLSRLVGSTGRVLAVEAHPRTAATLRQMVKLNRLSNVAVLEVAVTRDGSPVVMSDLADAASQENRIVTGGAGVPVEGRTLDAIVEEHGLSAVDFLKVNIEGAEVDAFAGGSRALSLTRHAAVGCHDFLADETGDETYRTKETVRDLLERQGFELTYPDDERPWAADYLYARSTSGR